MFGRLAAPFTSAWTHLKEVMGLHDPSELTIEDFRLELAELGLLGQPFGPEEYRAALEERLGIEIHVEELPDAEGGGLAGMLSGCGILAEVVVHEESGGALILVRESLRYKPWPAYELSIFHELSHLAAGHPLRAVSSSREERPGSKFRAAGSARLARRDPSVPTDDGLGFEELKREVCEPEARRRANWLVLAGACPGAFESDKTDRLT